MKAFTRLVLLLALPMLADASGVRQARFVGPQRLRLPGGARREINRWSREMLGNFSLGSSSLSAAAYWGVYTDPRVYSYYGDPVPHQGHKILREVIQAKDLIADSKVNARIVAMASNHDGQGDKYAVEDTIDVAVNGQVVRSLKSEAAVMIFDVELPLKPGLNKVEYRRGYSGFTDNNAEGRIVFIELQ